MTEKARAGHASTFARLLEKGKLSDADAKSIRLLFVMPIHQVNWKDAGW
jgi:hypothetical protein